MTTETLTKLKEFAEQNPANLESLKQLRQQIENAVAPEHILSEYLTLANELQADDTAHLISPSATRSTSAKCPTRW